MPQEIRVLKCCGCHKFQTDIVNKAKKWMCKICGVRQSVMQEYGRGTGKECRLHVQKLNEANGMRKGTENSVLLNEYLKKCNNSSTDTSEAVKELVVLKSTDEQNKWLTFLDGPESPECNLSQIKINSKDVQQLLKKRPLKRNISNEKNINEDEDCLDSQEVNIKKEKRKNDSPNVSNVAQPDSDTERNQIITTIKLDDALQPRSQSKWNEFIDKEEQSL